MTVVQQVPTGRGFVEVADRVYVARYASYDVNVGLIMGEAGAVVVDSRAGLAQGREALDHVRHIAPDAMLRALVWTHVHLDHTLGARAFDPIEVVAHETVVETLPEQAAALVRAVRDGVEGEAPDGMVEAATDPRMPDRTFSSLGVIDLGDRVVELAHPGLGHSSSDITVAVPDAGLVFVGDLVEEAGPPAFGGDCHPLDWPATLDAVVGMTHPGTLVVPGHGDVVDRAYVEQARSDIGSVAQGIADAYAAGLDADDVLRGSDLEWPYPTAGLATAVRLAYAELERRGHPRGTSGPPPGASTLPLA